MTSHERVPLGEIRELLFADLDVAGARRMFKPGSDGDGPDVGSALLSLATAAEVGDADGAGVQLRLLLGSGPETRIRLQAWSLARRAGVPPAADAGRIRGVIVDLGLDGGVDTVAGYEDGSARYLNQGGSAIFWDAGRAEGAGIRIAIADLLEAGQPMVDATDLRDGDPPGPPGNDGAVISLLTDGGIHVTMGPADEIGGDELGGSVVRAALQLVVALIAKTQEAG